MPTLHVGINGIAYPTGCQLALARASGVSTMQLASGQGALFDPEPTATAPVWVTACVDPVNYPDQVLAVFSVTGVTGDQLTGVTVADGYTDCDLPAACWIECRLLAEHLAERDDALSGTLTPVLQDKGGAVYNVKAYGATGDGTTDDTTAIAAAFAAAPEGATVLFPTGRYKVTTLTVTKSVNIVGDAGFTAVADVMGSSQWVTNCVSGSVLESTVTSGTILTLSAAAQKQVRIDGLSILGLGNNSRTTVGLAIGSASVASTTPLLTNVQVFNCSVGFRGKNLYEYTITGLRAAGCATGLSLSDASNSGAILASSISACGTAVAINGCESVTLQNCSIQGSTTAGVTIVGSAIIAIHGCYFENQSNAGHELSIDANSTYCTVGINHAYGGTISIAGDYCLVQPWIGSAALTITSAATGTLMLGGWGGTYTNSGTNTRLVGSNAGGYAESYPALASGGIALTPSSGVYAVDGGTTDGRGARFGRYTISSPDHLGEIRASNGFVAVATAGDMYHYALAGSIILAADGGLTRIDGPLKLGSYPEHADNAAAVTAGLAVGRVYRTGDILKVVHS